MVFLDFITFWESCIMLELQDMSIACRLYDTETVFGWQNVINDRLYAVQ